MKRGGQAGAGGKIAVFAEIELAVVGQQTGLDGRPQLIAQEFLIRRASQQVHSAPGCAPREQPFTQAPMPVSGSHMEKCRAMGLEHDVYGQVSGI